jgi:hypothetical protein
VAQRSNGRLSAANTIPDATQDTRRPTCRAAGCMVIGGSGSDQDAFRRRLRLGCPIVADRPKRRSFQNAAACAGEAPSNASRSIGSDPFRSAGKEGRLAQRWSLAPTSLMAQRIASMACILHRGRLDQMKCRAARNQA